MSYDVYQPLAVNAALANGVPANIFTALIQSESSFRPFTASGDPLTSSTGAVGIAQILPSTAANPGYGISPVNPADPTASLNFAAQYLRAQYDSAPSSMNTDQAWVYALGKYKGASMTNPDGFKQAQAVFDDANQTFSDSVASDVVKSVPGGVISDPPKKDDSIVGQALQSIKDFVLSSALGLTLGIVGVMIILFSLYSLFMHVSQNSTINKLTGSV